MIYRITAESTSVMEELEYDSGTKSLKRNYRKRRMLSTSDPFGELVQVTSEDDNAYFEEKWLVLVGPPETILPLIDSSWPMADLEIEHISDILLSCPNDHQPILISYPIHGYVGRAMMRNPRRHAIRATHSRIVADMYDVTEDRVYIFEPELAL